MTRADAMAAARHRGGREQNEDAVVVDAARGIAIVADGMGGVCAGVVAGQLACAGLAHLLGDASEEGMRRAFAAINALVFAAARDERVPDGELGEIVARALDGDARAIVEAARDPKRMSLHGMAAAAVACALRDGGAVIGHAGDARAYRLRGGALQALTRDHDLARDLPALASPPPPHLARIITRAIGVAATIEPTTCAVEVAAGDVLLLCTDGLHRAVTDDAIADVLARTAPAQARCDALIERALAGGGAYPDNVAVAIIDVGDRSRDPGAVRA